MYRAIDRTLGVQVAIKVLHQRFVPESVTTRRFVEEAQIIAQFGEPADERR